MANCFFSAIFICSIMALWNLTDLCLNEKRLKFGSISQKIFALCVLTVILMIINDSFTKDGLHRNDKVESILTKYWRDRDTYPEFWSALQSKHECCGINGSNDYGSSVPLSCYQTQRTWLIWKQTLTFCNVHENGCYHVIVNYLNDLAYWFKLIGISFVSFGVFSIVGMLLTLFLYLLFGPTTTPKTIAQV